MRRAMIIGAIASLGLITPQSNAAITLTHSAPLPCAVACSYWHQADLGYDECNPFPEGSYDKTLMRIGQTGTVHIEATSPIDYDTFVCTATSPSLLVVGLANELGEDCNGIAGNNAVAVGCTEEGDVTYAGLTAVNGGFNADQFWIISYNWSDNGTLPVKVTGPATVINDNYTAAGLPI
jgi:hypothetical protein